MNHLEIIRGNLDYTAKRQKFVLKDVKSEGLISSLMTSDDGELSLNDFLKRFNNHELKLIIEIGEKKTGEI